jgi:putative transposase
MNLMGVEAVYPRKRTTIPGGPSGVYPYKLRDLDIVRPNQVWCADITYIPMAKGFMYLFAIMDWHSPWFVTWTRAPYFLSGKAKGAMHSRSSVSV